MRRLIWPTDAIGDLRAIRSYIAESNPAAASRVAAALMGAANGLTAFPDHGRPVRPGVRDLTTVRPYVIRYAVLAEQIRVTSIRHSARRPAP